MEHNLSFNDDEKQVMRGLGVTAVVLFGSHATGNARGTSDFDIGILLQRGVSSSRRKEIYDQLYDLLSSKIKRLVDIDIVFLQDAPMELQSHVGKYGIALYEETPRTLADYREHVMDSYADFAPLRALFHQAILSRIS